MNLASFRLGLPSLSNRVSQSSSFVTKVRRAEAVSRDDWTVPKELRQMKKQLKEELFSDYLLQSLAAAKGSDDEEELEKADELDKLYEELFVNDISFESLDRDRNSYYDEEGNSDYPWLQDRERIDYDQFDELGEDSEYERWRL